MPTTIAQCLETLENKTLSTKNSLFSSFESLRRLFVNQTVSSTEVHRILSVFVDCLKEDIQCLPHAIGTILSLLTSAKKTNSIPVHVLLPSALELLHTLKTICISPGTESLRELGFNLFLSYPVEVLSVIVENNCTEILKIFKVYETKGKMEIKIDTEVCGFLQKLLIELPPEPRKQFVKEGLPIWFHEFIPTVMHIIEMEKFKHKLLYLKCLETLADLLVLEEYSQCEEWESVLQNICDPEKYPLIIMNLLKTGSATWHRLWIVFVKLLKNQITQNCVPSGTPINFLLPVVELGFKKDVTNRCRSFECWDSLIDNFSNETNENCMPKRIKLLLIPLKLNNAKTDTTALAKFHTWWHLITKFQYKIDKFTNEILIAFIHFAFGREVTGKSAALAGASQLYSSVKLLCLQAFSQIVGHCECDCCSRLPTLSGKLMNIKLLVDDWGDWIFALKAAIKLSCSAECKNANTIIVGPKPIICIWKAFVTTIAELPPNGVRRDMFDGLIQVLMKLTECCHLDENFSGILFSLALSLFDDTKHLLTSVTEEEELPLQKIISMISCPAMIGVYTRLEAEVIVDMLKPITNTVVQTNNINWLINHLSSNESGVKLWTALVHSVKESKLDIRPKTLTKLLAWLVNSTYVNEDKYAAVVWYSMYNLISNFKSTYRAELEQDIMKCLTESHKSNTVFFKLCISMCVLKNKLLTQEDYGILPNILKDLTSQMTDYKEFEKVVPMLIDIIVVMLNNAKVPEKVQLAQASLSCVHHVLRVIISKVKSDTAEAGNQIDADIFVILNNLFFALGPLFKIPEYSDANCDFIEKLRKESMPLSKESSLFTFIVNHMTTLKVNSIDIVKNKMLDAIVMLNRDSSSDTDKKVNDFTSQDEIKMNKDKKKEASIVNTVVENGEEYVVVKSNWKFNPQKLTENQKEKLQRKRDDIPALYQDLSQSQDEFRLKSWKTASNSLDTSSNSMSGKSNTKTDASSALKNIPCADLVPNVIVDIMVENDEFCTRASALNDKDSDIRLQSDTPCEVKRFPLSTSLTRSPRMAIKDRVFRNVKNLIEKSSPKISSTEKNITECQIEQVLMATPDDNSKVLHSAPSLLSANRPQRTPRKPKKFDDVELFALKKLRIPQIKLLKISSHESSHENNTHNSDIREIINESNSPNVGGIRVDQQVVGQSTTELNKNSDSVQNIPEKNATIVLGHINKGCVLDIQRNTCSSEDMDFFYAKDSLQNDIIQDVPKEDDSLDKQKGKKNDGQENIIVEDNEKAFATPKKKNMGSAQNSTTKKSGKKRSRIESELAIDMVEGHPFLKVQSEKRLTRKKITNPENSRRKSLNDKLNLNDKLSVALKTNDKVKVKTKTSPKANKRKNKSETDKLSMNCLESTTVSVDETRERSDSQTPASTTTTMNEDAPCSEDVIESSQDSTFTNISVKRITKLLPVVTLDRMIISPKSDKGTQDLLQESDYELSSSVANKIDDQESKDDIEFSHNKIAEGENNQSGLTENMDTEQADNIPEVIIISDDTPPQDNTVDVNTAKSDLRVPQGDATQELSEADTQPNNAANFPEIEASIESPIKTKSLDNPVRIREHEAVDMNSSISVLDIREQIIVKSVEPNEALHACSENDTEISSPFKNDTQRMKDFLNNTSEISPIKIQSPNREKSSPQESSSDYMIVKLTSPVQSNGEPFDKSDSPEFFTGEKVFPNKRDLSPPRTEVSLNSGSPSSSLSLKKNRPQALRPSGRAAHMLGLCVPESLNTIRNLERVELDEPSKGTTSTPVRRNLRVLYAENNDNLEENEVNDNFLKLKKDLPSSDSSPSIPILKRKHIMTIYDDETTTSPAGKKKRVSFHDPPVSSTFSVQKYIEPGCIKSPSSASKKLDRPITRGYLKPSKRTDNSYVKLDTVLSKAVESFTEEQADSLTVASLDITPAAEVVNTSELNDIDPICPELLECKDSIENIAVELSSPAMKDLFIKELEGKVSTIGDLAKMTELEINRLCIKAPKVQIAKKTLYDYVNKRVVCPPEVLPETKIIKDESDLEIEFDEEMVEVEPSTACMVTQTQTVAMKDQTQSAQVQTTETVKLASTQTDIKTLTHTSVQTVESGSKTTCAVISTCLSERRDFVDNLCEQLDEASRVKITKKLHTDTIIDILADRCDDSTPTLVLKKAFEKFHRNLNIEGRCKELAFINDHLCTTFDSIELMRFCSDLLKNMCDKPA